MWFGLVVLASKRLFVKLGIEGRDKRFRKFSGVSIVVNKLRENGLIGRNGWAKHGGGKGVVIRTKTMKKVKDFVLIG